MSHLRPRHFYLTHQHACSNIRNRLQHGLYHPTISEKRARGRRHPHHRCSPPPDDHGLHKDRESLLKLHDAVSYSFAKKMVLDAGKLVEFDTPAALLKKEGGFFKSLVDNSGDRSALYAMASVEMASTPKD